MFDLKAGKENCAKSAASGPLVQLFSPVTSSVFCSYFSSKISDILENL